MAQLSTKIKEYCKANGVSDVDFTTDVRLVDHSDGTGVHIEHCMTISKHIEEHFDRDIEDYQLTVCSAGLDNPFMVDQQYHKYNGQEVGVLLNNGKRKKGIILSYENDVLTLETLKKKKGRKKSYITEELRIPQTEIKETKLKINFK